MIKVLWGSEWDALFARDHDHVLLRQLAATPDGQFQTLGANDGTYNPSISSTSTRHCNSWWRT